MGPRFMEMGYFGGLHKKISGGACPWTPLAFRDFHIFLVGALNKLLYQEKNLD